MEVLLVSLVTFVSTSLGGIFAIKFKDKLHYIMSFTAGVLIAVCFFDIIPEAFSLIRFQNLLVTPMMIAVVIGFMVFHILEKTILIHHTHEDEYVQHRHPAVGLIGALGLAFHSFLDGVGIGLGFQAGGHVGFIIAFAVIAHDFSDGLNTVALMLSNKNTTRNTKLMLVLDAVAPILGALSTLLFHIPANMLILYLGFFTGFLLYIGASDLLPEAHSKFSSYRQIGLTILGIVLIFFVTRFV
jgi:zinc transporter ZupT